MPVDDRIVGSTLDAHRLLHMAKDAGRQEKLLNVLFEANFAKAETIFTTASLLALAERAGIERERARAVLDDPRAYLDAVRKDEKEAAQLGANGVPYFLIERRHALSGAQSVETFADALQAAWNELGTEEFTAEGAACSPDGACAVPAQDVRAGSM